MNEQKKKEAIKLYIEGNSCAEIKQLLHIPLDVRSIQRFMKKVGIIRSTRDSYLLAIKKGRVGAPKKLTKIKRLRLAPSLRYQILKRDGFRCLTCGATAKERLLEVDHIDFNIRNNEPNNLQTLCEFCNFGRRPFYRKNKLSS